MDTTTLDDAALVQAQIEELIALMENPPPHSVVMTLRPGTCEWVAVERNSRNRPEKTGSIKRFALDMATDGWVLNGATVVFTDQHRLGDGQNRMLACIKAGRPFTTHVVFGVPDGAFSSMDQGRVRSPADILHLEGVTNSTVMASGVRWRELVATGTVKRRTTFTPPQVLKLWRDKWHDIRDFLPEARKIAKAWGQPVAMVMALLDAFTEADRDFAADFSEAWADRSRELRWRPIRAMEELIESLSRSSSGRVHDVVRCAMIINAWNACMLGKKGRSDVIRWDLREPFPIILNSTHRLRTE